MRNLALLAVLAFTGALAADDKKDNKGEKVDPANLVGKWRQTKPDAAVAGGATTVVEFTKTGELKVTMTVKGVEYLKLDGKYTLSGSNLETVLRGPGRESQKKTLEIVKLTDAVLHTKGGKEESEWVKE